MLRRVGPVLALVACLAGPASAAPACRLLTDATGDAALLLLGRTGAHNDPALDIVSADLASNDRVLTVVIRPASLGDGDVDSTSGAAYELFFTTSGPVSQRFGVIGWRVHTDGDTGADTYLVTDAANWYDRIGPATVFFDEDRSEVRITVDLAVLRGFAPVGRGTRITDLYARSHVVDRVPLPWGDSDGRSETDAGSSRATYRMGSPSCVKPGS